MSEELRRLVIQFFQSIGAEIVDKEKVIEISKIKAEIANSLQISDKIIITFDPNQARNGIVLVSKGSQIIKDIQKFMSSQGTVSLLKMQINFDAEKFAKENITINNCKVVSLSYRNVYKSFVKFEFITTYHYLNEKESIKKEIIIYDGKNVDNKIPEFPLLDGRKEEVEIPDIKQDYEIAKNIVRDKIKDNTLRVSELVQNKLNTEIKRVEKHYSQLDKENEDSIVRARKLLNELEEKKRKGENVEDRIFKSREQVAKLEEQRKINSDNISKEREMLIGEEKKKHALGISTKLAQTIIVYHPIFEVVISLDSGGIRRAISLKFNPVNNQKELPSCEGCNKEVRDLFLCNSAHVNCESCLRLCVDCGQKACQKCLKHECSYCGRKPCLKCIQKCRGCSKYLCQAHSILDSINGGVRCRACSHPCQMCGKNSDKKDYMICSNCKKEVCKSCIRRVFANGGIVSLCVKCRNS